MKIHHTKFSPVSLLTCATLLSVALMSATNTARAQGGGAAPTRDLGDAERQTRSLEMQSGQKKDAKTIMAEINEDFGRLRVINEDIKKASATDQTLNYKSISVASAEIRKRATRLKTNLTGLPKADKDEKRQKQAVPLDDAQLRALLSSLNGTITSLVSNPVFSDMGSLDNQLAVKARRDLEGAIGLSEVAKKGAETLGKHP